MLNRRVVKIYLILMAVGITAYFLIPAPAQRLIYNSYSLIPAVAVIIGARANRSNCRRGWYGIAGFLFFWSLGDLSWAVLADEQGNVPMPSIADVFYFAGYPCLLAGILTIYGRRNAIARRIDNGLDALIVSLGIFVVGWTVSISASLESLSMAGQIVSVAYPALDTFVLGVALGLIIGFRRRFPSEGLLLAALALLVFADSGYGFLAASGSYRIGLGLDAMWLSVYALMGAAALHPSMAEMGRHEREPANGHLSSGRVVAIGLISAVPALTLLITLRTRGVHVSVIATLVIVGGGIVIWRLWRAIRSVSKLSSQHERLAAELSERVAQQERAKQALSASEQLFRSSFEDAPAGMTIVGSDGTFLRANHVFAELLGYDIAEIPGKRWSDFKFPEDQASSDEIWQTLLREGSIGAYERRYRRKDGSAAWALVTSIMVIDQEGKGKYALAQLVDMTAQKAADEALARMEEQLIQSQKMEAVGHLAGGVAHDFNNLIFAIRTSADFIAEGVGEDSPVHEDVEQIRESANNAADLVSQLLTFSRRDVVKSTVVDISESVAGMRHLLRRTLREDIDLLIHEIDPGAWVKMDPSHLQQIVMNLVVNARDALGHGGQIRLSTSVVDLPADAGDRALELTGRFACLTVSDTGEGMSAETKARIFDPFFTTKERERGTGLGLSTLYGIVHRAGGAVTVQSETGEGTTFEIFLPAVSDRPTKAVPVKERIQLSGKGRRILVVEDEAAVSRAIMRILDSGGYEVAIAGSMQEALALEATCEMDAVLTDVVMPGGSGKDLLDRLRESNKDLKSIYMSGYTDQIIAEQGVLEEGENFIQKPFSKDELLCKLSEVLAS